MEIILKTEAPPLHRDTSGNLRVGHSRVLLDLVIHAFQDGATPEVIVQRYSTATLADIYAVIAYYLRHREEIETYLAEREQQAQDIYQHIKQQQGDLTELRDRLHTHQHCRGSNQVDYQLWRNPWK